MMPTSKIDATLCYIFYAKNHNFIPPKHIQILILKVVSTPIPSMGRVYLHELIYCITSSGILSWVPFLATMGLEVDAKMDPHACMT